MPVDPYEFEPRPPAMEAFLLGRIDFDTCLQLQRRLLPEVAGRDDGQITLLLVEHDTVITVGRGGSPRHVRTESTLLRTGQIKTAWVNRGGGCLLHCPGQLAIYPLVPLRWHGLSIGAMLDRLLTAVVEMLDELTVTGQTKPGRYDIWSRSGQLAATGIAVRHGVTYYGMWLNVAPPMGLFRLVDADPIDGTPMSSLATERRSAVRMPTVRAALIRRLADAFGCDRYHLYTGHPLLRQIRSHGPTR
jgi:lipoyl(octanoyl) transferase